MNCVRNALSSVAVDFHEKDERREEEHSNKEIHNKEK